MSTSVAPQPGENEIECARCGAIFSMELTRCPKCGVSLYEPDELQQSISKPFKPHLTGFSARAAAFFRRLSGKPDPVEKLFSQSLQQAARYNDLIRKLGGDHLAVERLIEYESLRLPHANRAVWIQNAVQRWEQDNQ